MHERCDSAAPIAPAQPRRLRRNRGVAGKKAGGEGSPDVLRLTLPSLLQRCRHTHVHVGGCPGGYGAAAVPVVYGKKREGERLWVSACACLKDAAHNSVLHLTPPPSQRRHHSFKLKCWRCSGFVRHRRRSGSVHRRRGARGQPFVHLPRAGTRRRRGRRSVLGSRIREAAPNIIVGSMSCSRTYRGPVRPTLGARSRERRIRRALFASRTLLRTNLTRQHGKENRQLGTAKGVTVKLRLSAGPPVGACPVSSGLPRGTIGGIPHPSSLIPRYLLVSF